MRIVVFGASGFVGSRLLAALAENSVFDGFPKIDSLLATDLHPAARLNGESIKGHTFFEGDISDPEFTQSLFAESVDGIFHLAASLTLDAEMDFMRGLNTNVHALMRLLEHCRAQEKPPKFLFASSISSYGGSLPKVVDDFVVQTPQTSYGTHKAIAEQLINDYSRRGFVDGRILRFPVILTHPGPPTSSVSDRIASLIREPLSGRDAVCQLAPDTPIAVASVDKIVESMMRLYMVDASAFGATRAINQPALTVTPADITRSVRARLDADQSGAVHWVPDEAMQAIVDSWPAVFTSSLALELGLTADASVDALIDSFKKHQHV